MLILKFIFVLPVVLFSLMSNGADGLEIKELIYSTEQKTSLRMVINHNYGTFNIQKCSDLKRDCADLSSELGLPIATMAEFM